jgi:ribosome-associated protein
LLTLRNELFQSLPLSDKFRDAVADAKRITNFEGKRRQMQYIGKLMRKLEASEVNAVRAALEVQANGSAAENLVLHQSEHLARSSDCDETPPREWIAQNPRTDIQQLRALIRQARKDAVPEKPGAAVRHGRAYRDIFQLVREALTAVPDNELATTGVFTLQGKPHESILTQASGSASCRSVTVRPAASIRQGLPALQDWLSRALKNPLVFESRLIPDEQTQISDTAA